MSLIVVPDLFWPPRAATQCALHAIIARVMARRRVPSCRGATRRAGERSTLTHRPGDDRSEVDEEMRRSGVIGGEGPPSGRTPR